MSRRRLPAAGLGGMFSLAARVPIFSGYYTTPAVEGKGRADCASAARGPPPQEAARKGAIRGFPPCRFSRGRRWGEGAFLVRFHGFLGLWIGGGRFLCALPAGHRSIALRARAGAALAFFWADAQQGKGRGFLERKPPKELLRSLRSASLQLQLLPGVFPRFRQGAQGGQVLLIPVGVLQHALFVEAGAHQPLALL